MAALRIRGTREKKRPVGGDRPAVGSAGAAGEQPHGGTAARLYGVGNRCDQEIVPLTIGVNAV